MNYLDIVLALLLITGMIRGFIKGFIFEVAVLGALFLGLYAAFKFSAFAEPYVLKMFDANPRTVHYISSFIMFLVVSVVAMKRFSSSRKRSGSWWWGKWPASAKISS